MSLDTMWLTLSPNSQHSPVGFAKAVTFWTLVGLFFFSQDAAQIFYSNESAHWLALLECWLSRAYIWGLLVPLALFFVKRFRFDRRHMLSWLAVHAAFGSGIAALASILASFVGFALALPWYGPDLPTAALVGLAYGFHASFFTYGIILVIYEAFDNYSRAGLEKQRVLQIETHSSALRTELAQTQLGALKAQLRPHFLFNTLNTIVVLVRRKRNIEAEEMIGRLGELLRSTLDGTDVQEVPLRTELKFVQSYLDIECVRFRNRLTVAIDGSSEALDAMVPYMCLQPIAENAVKHGIARGPAAGEVSILARRVGSSLEVAIKDNGPGLAPDADRGVKGIGISNTRARLSHLYGDQAALILDSSCGDGTVATLRVPYHLEARTL